MEINLIRAVFILFITNITIIGITLSYLEPYLPALFSRVYRYGKFSSNADQPIVAKIEVNKRWFQHFYIVAAPGSSFMLYLILNEYLWKGNVHESIIWILDICLGSSRQAHVSSESTLVASVLLTLHCWKRFYETQYVNIFGDKKMNIIHYIVGHLHYVGTFISVIGESEGFVKGSRGNFSWERITYLHLICALVFISATCAQLHANIILRNLRINKKDGKINPNAYKIPHGGLFEYVSGALQITEIIIYMALSVVLWQNTTFHYVTFWVVTNQIVTAKFSHQWYIETFKDYPKSQKILIPFVF